MTAANLTFREIGALLSFDASVPGLLDISGPAFLSGGGLDQQVAHAHQVVGGQGEGPDPGQPLSAPVSGFAQQTHRLGPQPKICSTNLRSLWLTA